MSKCFLTALSGNGTLISYVHALELTRMPILVIRVKSSLLWSLDPGLNACPGLSTTDRHREVKSVTMDQGIPDDPRGNENLDT